MTRRSPGDLILIQATKWFSNSNTSTAARAKLALNLAALNVQLLVVISTLLATPSTQRTETKMQTLPHITDHSTQPSFQAVVLAAESPLEEIKHRRLPLIRSIDMDYSAAFAELDHAQRLQLYYSVHLSLTRHYR